MKLPNDVKAIRSRYLVAFPVPQGSPSPAYEEQARLWSIAFAEQVAFERPGQGWGMKRADPGRPISKDTIARQVGDTLLIWDLLIGTGTGHPTLAQDPESADVTGQVFVVVSPTNHLGTTVPDQPPAPPPVDLSPLLQRVVDLERAVDALKRRPPPPWPTYRGSKYGIVIISRAEE